MPHPRDTLQHCRRGGGLEQLPHTWEVALLSKAEIIDGGQGHADPGSLSYAKVIGTHRLPTAWLQELLLAQQRESLQSAL